MEFFLTLPPALPCLVKTGDCSLKVFYLMSSPHTVMFMSGYAAFPFSSHSSLVLVSNDSMLVELAYSKLAMFVMRFSQRSLALKVHI